MGATALVGCAYGARGELQLDNSEKHKAVDTNLSTGLRPDRDKGCSCVLAVLEVRVFRAVHFTSGHPRHSIEFADQQIMGMVVKYGNNSVLFACNRGEGCRLVITGLDCFI